MITAPIFGWLTHSYGWQWTFWFMGIFGIVLALAWNKTVYNVPDHPLISQGEIDYIERGREACAQILAIGIRHAIDRTDLVLDA